MGLELVLDERAAAGKTALADGAVKGQRGGGAEPTMRAELISICNHCATLAGADKPFVWELQTTKMSEKLKCDADNEYLTSTPWAVNEWRTSAA